MVIIEKLELEGDAMTVIYLKNYHMEEGIFVQCLSRRQKWKFQVQVTKEQILIQYKEGVASNVPKYRKYLHLCQEYYRKDRSPVKFVYPHTHKIQTCSITKELAHAVPLYLYLLPLNSASPGNHCSLSLQFYHLKDVI